MGYKIALANQETACDTAFTNTGVCWIYLLDLDNRRFKVPRNKYGFTGYRDNAGGFVEAGLPSFPTFSTDTVGNHSHSRGNMNITGTITTANWANYNSSAVTGAFYSNGSSYQSCNNGDSRPNCTFDASRTWSGRTSTEGNHSHTITANNVSSIYGKSTTVQSPVVQMYLYFYSGN